MLARKGVVGDSVDEVDGAVGVGRGVFVDGGKAAEEKTGDIGENGGAAGRDVSLGQESVKVGQGVVDALGGLESGGLAGEVMGEVAVLVGLKRSAGMIEAEIYGGVDYGHAAAAVGSVVLTARGVVSGAGLSGFGFHGQSSVLILFSGEGHTPGIFVRADSKGFTEPKCVRADSKGDSPKKNDRGVGSAEKVTAGSREFTGHDSTRGFTM